MTILILFHWEIVSNFRSKDVLNEMSPYFRKVVVAPQSLQQQIKKGWPHSHTFNSQHHLASSYEKTKIEN